MCLSKGQIQRILIARTIYKDADIYLFDEITNCLGEQMGNDIIEKIDLFLKEKHEFTPHTGIRYLSSSTTATATQGKGKYILSIWKYVMCYLFL